MLRNLANGKIGRFNIIPWNILFVERVLPAMISKRFACKEFYNIVFLLYTIHVEASLMRWLGEFQIAQIESLVLKLSKFVKICRTCLLLRLLEREVIHRVYLPFLRMTVWSSAKMISVRLTIVSCVIRDIREDMWFFSF